MPAEPKSNTVAWIVLGLVVLALLLLATRQIDPSAPREIHARAADRAADPAEPLLDVERNTIEIFRRVSGSVVSVANKAMVSDFFGLHVYEVPQGAGTGFLWDREGHIVSNYHVVHGASSVRVVLPDGTSYDAKLVGVDPDHDIAVLRIHAPGVKLVPVRLGKSSELQVGQSVLAIGSPFGLETSLSRGIVSALGRSIESMTGRRIHDVIQTDAAINPGNSGGPLLDSSGRLIGVNTAIMSASGSSAGVGFAVPVDVVRRVVPQLIATGTVKRIGLGIVMYPEDFLARRGLRIAGVMVKDVLRPGAANRAGIRGSHWDRHGNIVLGDVIVEVDGRPIATNDDLYQALERHEEGDRVNVAFMRGDKRHVVEVALQALN